MFGFLGLFGLPELETEPESDTRINMIYGPNPKPETRKTDKFGLFGFGFGSVSVNGFKMPSPNSRGGDSLKRRPAVRQAPPEEEPAPGVEEAGAVAAAAA